MTMIMLLGILALVALVPAAVITAILSARVSALKREVDALKHNGNFTPVELPASPIPHPNAFGNDAQLLDLIRRGEKLQAIKLYRERTGVGLKEAKDAVDALDRRWV